MACQRCNSERVAGVSGKVSDMCDWSLPSQDIEHDGYVPDGVGIGDSDYIELDYCMDCGQIQDTFPLPLSDIEKGEDEDDE